MITLDRMHRVLCFMLFNSSHTNNVTRLVIITTPHIRHICSKKHLKNVGPIRHCEPPHAALPFTRCHYCRVARRLRIDVHDDDDNNNDNA